MKDFIIQLISYNREGAIDNKRFFGRSLRLLGGTKYASPLVAEEKAARRFATHRGALVALRNKVANLDQIGENIFQLYDNRGHLSERYMIVEISDA